VGESGETIEELKRSFSYGTRSDLNFKFLKGLSDVEFGEFLKELVGAVAATTDDGNAARVVDVAYRWQVRAYGIQTGGSVDFPHRYDEILFSSLAKPLRESRVALLTSSGHFVEGDDPQPLGVPSMSQDEAEARIDEFLREAPQLSLIPIDTPADELRVRHGGYPVQAVAADHQVVLPLGHLKLLEANGTIGEVLPTAYSFVGATSQVRLKKRVASEWAEMLREEKADAVLLVPI
jgi:glycine/betaine/sarcosine/D-proline reductase family selenoprotein B